MVDSSSPDRFTEAADALREVMGHEKIVGKPLLVFANKKDVTEACSEAQLTSSMALEEMVTQEQLQVVRVLCSIRGQCFMCCSDEVYSSEASQWEQE